MSHMTRYRTRLTDTLSVIDDQVYKYDNIYCMSQMTWYKTRSTDILSVTDNEV